MTETGSPMRIVIFSEEYVRITKGMFNVCCTQAKESSKRHEVLLLLNREHWGADELTHNPLVAGAAQVQRLSFYMPSSVCKRVFHWAGRPWLARAVRYVLGQFLNASASPIIVLLLAAKLSRLNADAVFIHNGGWPAGQLCRWAIVAAWMARIPSRILSVHNYPSSTQGGWSLLHAAWRRLQARTMELCATEIVTVSDSLKHALEDQVFRRRVVRIHNGIAPDCTGARAAVPGLLPWSAGGPTVGFVGALYPLKGPHVLLDAFARVKVPCELALLGPCEPKYRGFLDELAGRCGNPVTFLGFQDDVDGFLGRIDMLVVPSIAFESFGMVILEAMRKRKPVICTDFGGMKEIVVDGYTGLVVPAGNVVALADAITKLLKEPQLRHDMGEAGFVRFMALFTSDTMAQGYERLLRSRDATSQTGWNKEN